MALPAWPKKVLVWYIFVASSACVALYIEQEDSSLPQAGLSRAREMAEEGEGSGIDDKLGEGTFLYLF